MSNKGGRVSPDYLADIAPEYAIINVEKYNSEEKTELISSYAQMLAASMGNLELRETIKDEAQINSTVIMTY